MALLSSSFVVDIEEAVLAELESKLGTGSTVYPSPGYLLLAYVGRGEVVPRLELNAAKTPGLLMQYVSGEKREGGIGVQLNRERWNIGALIRLTPAMVGCDATDWVTFRRSAHASADVLARRLRKALIELRVNVVDTTFGERTNGRGVVDGWGIIPQYENDQAVSYAVLVEYHVDTELDR